MQVAKATTISFKYKVVQRTNREFQIIRPFVDFVPSRASKGGRWCFDGGFKFVLRRLSRIVVASARLQSLMTLRHRESSDII
jgi:hypothetical protein